MKQLGFLTLGIVVISLLAGCSGGGGWAPSSTPDASSANRTAMSTVALTGLSGRIVYAGSKGLRIYNVATGADVSLGVSGANPKFSPNGALIAYSQNGLHVMKSDGTNNTLLNATGQIPSFDPTSTIIAYSNNGIWKINVNGTGRTQLTSVGIEPTWSPDGTQIAYNATTGGGQQLFLMNADGTNPHKALSSAAIIDTVWLPSSKILFGLTVARNYQLYSYDPLNPASLTRLTSNTLANFEPSWSPDASHISWTRGTSGSSAGIWIMNADGTGQQGPVIAKGRQGSWGP